MITAKVVSAELDENGNIKVNTEYRDDAGNLIQNGVTRYSFSVDNDPNEILAKVEADAEEHAKALMARTYAKNRNSAELSKIIAGIKNIPEKQVSSASIKQNNKELLVKEDGVISSVDIP